MSKLTISLLMLMLSSTAFADPQAYSCERKAWKSTKDCDVNNMFEAYVFYVDSEEFTSDQQANKRSFRYEKPKNFYTLFHACGSGKTYTYFGKFTTNDETATFWVKADTARIIINLNDMTATLKPAKYGDTLKCEKVQGLTADEYTLLKEDARNFDGITTAPAYFY